MNHDMKPIMTNNINRRDTRRCQHATTRFAKHAIRLAAALLVMIVGGQSAKAADYVIMAQSGDTWHFYAYSSTQTNNYYYATDATSFSYSTCVWSGTSGNSFRNSNNTSYGLYYNTNGYLQNRSYYDNFTISGNTIYSSSYYICYYNNAWYTYSSSVGTRNVLYSISGPTAASWTTAVSISGSQTTFADLGSFTYSASAELRPPYYTLTGNGTYYVVEGGTPDSTAPASSSDGITYTWSLNDDSTDDGHVRINASTGEVTYYNSYASNTNTTIKVTATHTASGATTSTTKQLTFNSLPVANPTGITATDKTIAQGDTWTADNYTLTADAGYQAYSYVTAESSNTSVATVTNTAGGFTVTGVATGTATITITAYNQDATEAYTTTFTLTVSEPSSGVSGDTVTLNDYEDHTWTYYSGVDTSVDGGNYNTNYAGKLYSPNPRNVKITYKANGGAVSIDESETEFVYYKTIEKVNGAYTYTVISNPFSKRPTGKGFGGWQITSGAGYISGHNVNDVLDLDEELTLTGLDTNYTPNCTSAEIVLEATWVTANIYKLSSWNTTSNNGFTYNTTYGSSSGTYETNILVVNRNYSGTITSSLPVTIMMVEPDGSADYRNNYTFSGNITPNNDGVTKIEFARWTTTNAINATGRNFTIGRGIQRPSGGGTLYGTNTNRNINQTFKVESGIWQHFYAIGSNGPSNNMTKQHIIFGNDYDRANTDNEKLTITNNMRLLDAQSIIGTNKLIIKSKSGKFTTELDHATAQASGNCFYLWHNNSTNTATGLRTLIIEGGEFWHIAGGVDYSNSNDDVNLIIRMKGGTVHGSVYGGAARYDAHGGKQFVFTGGTVEGWIAGGSNGFLSEGSGNDNGSTQGNSYVYVGGTTQVNSNGSTTAINVSLGGNVYGAGCGNTTTDVSGRVTLGTNVVVADNSYVERSVYGGGAYGSSPETANVYITGNAHVGGVNDPTFNVQGGVYGGARAKGGTTTNIYMTGGLVETGVYGGSNYTGTISGNVTMQINGGQVGTSSTTANIHGGGYGSATRVSGNVDITLGASGQTDPGVTVYGDVYGGSALGYVNGTTANTTYHTNVTLNKGIINGSLYGGALGDASTAANVYGPVQVTVNGGSVKKTDSNGANGSGAVYGCNNINGAPQSTVKVDIYGTDPAPSNNEYALFAVYGGGNQANYAAGTPTVTVHNCSNSIEYVYGGGNAAHITNGNTDVTIYGGNKIGNVFGGGNGQVTAANVSGNTNVKIYGGTIGKVFGGSNSAGTIGDTINVTVQKQTETGHDACAMHIDEVYGGGNMAASNAGNISIGCTGAEGEGIGDVYGGANQADITGDIALNITGGSIDRVFGGNNVNGSISGGIQVDVNWNTTNPCGYNYLGSVFGAGNLAQYTIPSGKALAVNILNGTVSGNVYGGGKGDANDHTKGQVTGNPVVTIGDNNANHQATVTGDVYGGGDAGDVSGTPQVNVINKCNTTITNVYGGGNAADVNGTDVNIDGGNITGMVFGGGHGDKNANPQTEANVNGDVAVDVTGGTINKVFGGSNSKGNITGTVDVNIAKGANSCEMHITEVYGGGNEAAGNAGTITIGCTGGSTEGIGDVYGGANAADINNNIALTIKGGSIQRVFGGNNASGTISGTIQVDVNWDSSLNCGNNYLGSVFGGGNVAAYSGTPDVNIINGTVSHNVYGGGNEAGVGGGDVTMSGGTVLGGIYGGCNTSGTVDGNIVVNITDGTVGSSTTKADGIFGGGYGSATATTGNIDVNINGASAVIYGDVYGGSALGNVNSDTNDYTHVTLTAGTIHGDAYGGGLGDDSHAALVNGNVVVTQNGVPFVKATITDDNGNEVVTAGRIFGCNNLNGSPQGTVLVLVNKTSDSPTTGTYDMNAVYGGGNLAPYNPATIPSAGQFTSYTDKSGNTATHDATGKPLQVVINGCDNVSIEYVYGGGNAAPTPSTDVVVLGAYELGYVFGGGNGKDKYTLDGGTTWNTNPGADVGIINGSTYGSGDANTSLYGGTIHEAYGASNQKGTIKGNINLDVKEGEVACDLSVDKIVGAGKNADVDGDIILVMGCMPADKKTDLVFGGADNANVNGNVELTITSGTFGQVFGGNNLGGIIKGHIKLNIEETGCNPIKIDELYLGGNEAAYSRFGYYEDGTLADGRTKYSPRTSADDTHTAVTNPDNTDNKHPFPYAEPELNVISCTSIGKVFGGGLGTGAAMYADPTVNINMVQGAFYNQITATSDNPKQLGAVENVYGGGNEAAVHGNTTVNIATKSSVDLTSTSSTESVLGAYISGTVYGAGKGVVTDPNAAIVTGNTLVDMRGGHVSRSIYGGGELGSVGTFTEYYTDDTWDDNKQAMHFKDEPKTCQTGTGKAEVLISGGQVGLVQQLMPKPSNPTSDDDFGYVFCASKGVADSVTYAKANLLAVVNETHLKISGTALIAASAYGGSENGEVLGNTYVEIQGGQIGIGHYVDASDNHNWDPAYTTLQWNKAIAAVKSGVVADINAEAANFHQCDAWEFGAEGSRHVYDYFAGTTGYDAQGGAKPGSDGHSFFGHVFGGGSGYYPFAAGKWRRTAGRVCGNTLVEISGGHVLTNVYGGNEITDVLGKSKVEMWGGTVGIPRTVDSIQARPVNCNIFGAGMGDPRVLFNGWSNVGSAEVIVRGDAVVFGSVFGGGEDGHILGDASTTIKGNAFIGTYGTSGVDGNIFGSGRGFSAITLTAGATCGNVTVDISENAKILGSVYGGGRMAAVGSYLAEEGTTNYGKLQTGTAHGNVTINITGGTIGTQEAVNNPHDYSVGDVFGGSKGVFINGETAKSQRLGLVKNTTVNISGTDTQIYGNVYGGGELASVGSYTYATAATGQLAAGDVSGLDESGTGIATINITGGKIGQNSVTDTHGLVFGGCLGRAGTIYSGYSFVNKSFVTLDGGVVYGSIFGGGENGHVFADTDVKIKSGTVGIALDKSSVADADLDDNMIFRGNVYGGGRGIDTYNNSGTQTYSITAGKVNGNTNVTITGGTIYRNVYGGGSLASVGDSNESADQSLVTTAHPFPYATGQATVTIKGGKIGTDGGQSANNYTTKIPVREARRENGFVYGSGRGMAAGSNNTDNLIELAYTNNTLVNIEDGADVTGSIFGGGENGHVRLNTRVLMTGGVVGTEQNAAEHEIDDNGRGRLIYRGNVYGGGRGIDTNSGNYSLTAGRVYGDTYVKVSGGHIYHDVFGGGSLASVGTVTEVNGEEVYTDETGNTEVHINGGVIGYSETESNWGFNCGFVYGGCRGLSAAPGSDLVKMAYVHNAKVYIEDGADVKGSVFGGGANGHVNGNTYVEISGGSIGTKLLADEVGFDDHGVANKPVFRGNVYAGGRGVDLYQQSGSDVYSLTAGAVYGNATLLMTGGHVWHNVYGSGAMASVGTIEAKPAGTHVHDEIVDESNTVINPDTEVNYLTGVFKDGTGTVHVTIKGGTVGDTTSGHEGRNNGRVYGAGRGVSANRSDYVASMEYVNKTYVTIGTEGQTSYTAGSDAPYIYGAVFGGGENGHVKTDTDVKIHSGIIGWPLVKGENNEYATTEDGSTKNPFRGHVFGGGRGVDIVYHGVTEERSSTAGRVYGHTNVTMTGGVVRRAIYGGGLLASVGMYKLSNSDMHIIDKIEDEVNGGNATVTVSGGYIGNVNSDGSAISGDDYLKPGDDNGHIFGSSCGMVADNYVVGTDSVDIQYKQMGYSHSTEVNISGNAHIFGCVFGSGENGHVWEDAKINISGGQIGSDPTQYSHPDSTTIYIGNVYGSGRGVDHPHAHISETAGKVRGNTTVNITGGTIWRDVYGGGSLASVGEKEETADDSKKNETTDPLTNNPFPYSTGLTRVVVDGTTTAIHGSVYGSGRGVASTDTEYNQAAYVKNTLVTIKGSAHIYKNVFGGGNAGHVRRNTVVTTDGTPQIDGNVYGGGAGDLSSPTAGLVNHDVEVNIGGGLIKGDVYGGGAIANTNTHDKRNDSSLYPDKASTYGSPSENEYAKTEVNLTGGIILGDAYGGGQGVIPADDATAAQKANAGALVRGDVTVTLNGTAFLPKTKKDDQNNDIAAAGRVFGCNNLNGTPQGTVLVKVLQTKGVTESGGTYTINTSKPTKNNTKYEVQAVYGGGNLAAYDPWDANATGQYTTSHSATNKPLQVLIDGCDLTSIEYVYGGGNAAATPSTDVTVLGAYEIGSVFGGGNGKDRISYDGTNYEANPGADVGILDGSNYGAGTADAYLHGGTIHNAFGGSNTLGNVRVKAEVHLDEVKDSNGDPVCALTLDEIYGGGNEAYMAGGTGIELGCISYLKTIYGGAKAADVGDDIVLTITSGHFDRVFGGNNVSGVIGGSITVNIEETGCNPITIGELYGCGNQAAYTTPSGKADPTINVKSFTSIGRIFGGGLGAGAKVTGNPTVKVDEIVGANATTASTYAGTTRSLDGGATVTLPTHESGSIGAIGTIFGGGNEANVVGNTNVLIGTQSTINYTSDAAGSAGRSVVGADIRNNVFGGGNQAEVSGNTNVVIGKDATATP